jgi:DNA-binding transcriptional LysR family regulator
MPQGQELEWSDLSVILAVCRTGSLSGAARNLGYNHSTIFRRINKIEENTGVRFFERLPHGYVMTDAGETAMRYAEKIETEVQALSREVLGQDMRLQGRVRVTSPEGIATDHMPRAAASFCRINPGISIDIIANSAALDLSRREAEVAIRATARPPDNAFGRKICDFRFALYAAPAYLDRIGDIPLQECDWCMLDGVVSWLVPSVWKKRELGDARVVFSALSTRSVVTAAVAGMGITALPVYMGDAEPRLVRVSNPLKHLDMELWALTHPDLKDSARVRAVMEFLYGFFRTNKDLFSGERPTGKPQLIRTEV